MLELMKCSLCKSKYLLRYIIFIKIQKLKIFIKIYIYKYYAYN